MTKAFPSLPAGWVKARLYHLLAPLLALVAVALFEKTWVAELLEDQTVNLRFRARAPFDPPADPRLAGFRGQTFGLKYGIAAGQSGEFSVRVEHYTQKGSTTSSPLPGLQGLDLYPGMQALMIQAGLRFTF